LELEPGFARRVSQRFHAAVVAETRAVEGDGFDAGGLGLFSDTLADQGRSSNVAALPGLVRELRTHFGFERRRAGEHLGAARREHLRIDVRVRAMHGETRDLQLSDLDTRL